ncbi:MAG: hypothetical protein J6N53_00535 [Lachnospiraceae bacterium]|nr:hypothetical protein [Lachnospiraceae bacterium]
MEFMDRYDEVIEKLRKQEDTPLNRLPGFIQDFLEMRDKTDEDRLFVETVRTMILARPYFTARDAFTVGFLLESMCYHYKELIPVDKEKGIYMRKFKKGSISVSNNEDYLFKTGDKKYAYNSHDI